MTRSSVHVRDARPADAAALLRIWTEASQRAVELQPTAKADAEASSALARIAAEPDERLVVGLVDDDVVGAMHLRRAPVSPIHSETAIHASFLHVLDQWRRRGVGRALLEAAVSWAEEKDTTHVLAASTTSSRDTNRFMARLGLGPVAIIRGAPVHVLRAKLPREVPAGSRGGTRSHPQLSRVLAHRRSQRRRAAGRT